MRALLILLPLLASMASAADLEIPYDADAEAALVEGGRLVRDGRLEDALAVYTAAYEGAEGAEGLETVLAYNLGTVSHRLDRLPEAILWYRRAEAARPRDPELAADLEENLELARRSLEAVGVPPADSPSGWALWIENRQRLTLLGVALAWAALPLLALRPGLRMRILAPVAALSCLSFGAGQALPDLGPRPAVLLEHCPESTEDGLPAGTEIWVTTDGPEAWRLESHDLRCPGTAVGLVEP